jgi:LytS/YehU family sensor histidine kinase
MNITSKPSQQVSIGNIAGLTTLVLAFVVGTGTAIASLVGSTGVSRVPGVLALALMQAVYLALANWMARRAQAPAAPVRRYALRLQLQALAEILMYIAMLFPLIVLPLYFLEGSSGSQPIHAILQDTVFRRSAAGIAAALPAIVMLLGTWRLHHLSSTPQALLAAADNSLPYKTLRLGADADTARDALARHVERLTDTTVPGLTRFAYGRPKVVIRQGAQHVAYELVWINCPTRLTISLTSLDEQTHDVSVVCELRRGIYKIFLFATPADALAQMQYIEAHLLHPLRAQLAMLSAERQRDALRDQAVEAQLRILQAQIEPHFLFNSLANVRHLYREDVGAGEHMLDHLIAYLRCAMDDLRAEHSTVRKEIDLARHYLTIMQIRMGERLGYSFTAPDSLLEHPFPPAMLISLVENAIKHGLADADQGRITLSAVAENGRLSLSVADDGRGFSSVGGTGVGLSNIRRRLEAMYGHRAWLEVGAPPAGGFHATIVIPLDSSV